MHVVQRAKIQYLVRIADQYWGTARLMWTLGSMHSAMHNLNQAVELYLRAAWLTEQDFTDEAKMNSALRAFHKSDTGKSHDYATMLSKLPKTIQDAMKAAKVQGFTLASDSVSRYGDGAGLGYGEGMMREVDSFIKVIRGALGYENPRSSFGIVMQAVSATWPGNQATVERGVKMILSSKNVLSKKKRAKRLRQAIHRAMNRSTDSVDS